MAHKGTSGMRMIVTKDGLPVTTLFVPEQKQASDIPAVIILLSVLTGFVIAGYHLSRIILHGI